MQVCARLGEITVTNAMSIRMCVFKDCPSFYSRLDSTACSGVTFFSFPKDPSRAELWRSLGQVNTKISSKHLFMCSKHFEDKYLSRTQNRTILVGQAVPIAYKNTMSKGISQMEDDELDKMTSPSPNLITVNNGSYNPQNSPCKTTENTQNFYIDLEDDDDDDDHQTSAKLIVVQSNEANDKKIGKQFEVSIVPPSLKRVHSPSPSVDDSAEEDDDQLINLSEVSIFKMKGEEYVQMSRKYYLNEKRQMMNQLQSYRQVIRNIDTLIKNQMKD